MSETGGAPDLTGPFANNPFAEWQRPPTQAEATYRRQRNTAAGGGGGFGNQVHNGPAGLNDSGAFWRSVQDNELSGHRLTRLLDRGGAYIQGARSRVGRAAAARGAFNTNQAIAEGEAAAIDRGGEFAMQEADAFGRAAQANQDAFNQMRIAQERNLTDVETTAISAGANVASAQIRVSGDLIQQDRDQRWRSRENELDRDLDRENREDGQTHDRDMQDDRQEHDMDVLAEAERLRTSRDLFEMYLNNPDLWGDPEAMAGFRNTMYEIFPELRPRDTGSTGGSRPPNSGTGAQPTSTPIGPSAGSYTRPGRASPAPDPYGATAGPSPTGASPAGATGPRPAGGSGGGSRFQGPRVTGRGGASTGYRSMRNMGARP